METKFRGRNGGNQAGRPGTRTARGSTQYGDRIDAPTEGQVSVATADGNAERAPVGHATGHPRDGRFRESAMSIETRRETRSETEADEDAEVADRNAVAVHFADGTVASYAVVVRAHDEDWLYAERLVGEGDGLDEEEVARFSLDPSERLELWRLELKLKGGGTNPAVSVDVYDVTNDAVLGRTSDRATGGKSPVGTSGTGATIVVRVTNTSGAAQDVTISGITGVVAGTAAVDVFVAAGQSNALGRGRASRSPDVPRGAAFEYKWTEDSIVPLDDPVGEDAPPEQQATTGSLWPAFATEYYARTGRPAVYVAYSSGGSGQTPGSRMDPDRLWSRGGTLYDDARDELLAALDYLEDEGFDPTVRGCVWLQGEQDAHAIDRRIISKSEYADAFEDHIDRWQSDVQDDFRFFVLQIGHERRGDTSGYRAVRAVQSAVANRRAYVHMVSTIQTNFPAEGKMQDALHYTQEGYNEAGETAGKNTAAVLDSRRVPSSDAGVLASTDDGVLSTTTDAAFETSRRR